MSTIANLISQITLKLTPQSGGDKVTASEVRQVLDLIRALLVERGVVILTNTAALSSIASTETLMCYVDDEGFFRYAASGVPDNVDSFAAQNGGIWERAIGVGGGGSVVLDSDLTAIANLSPSNNDIIQRIAGAWVNRSMAQLKSSLGLAKTDVGLGNVDNTPDASKPISTTQQAALDNKADKSTTINGHTLSANVTVTKGDLGLGSVDNTADASKPVSAAQQVALDLKEDKHIGTKTSHGFVVGEGVYKDSTGWHRSTSVDNTITCRAHGVVIQVIDANNFLIGKKGAKFTGSGFTPDANAYLGTASPNYTFTEPTAVGHIRQILFQTTSATEGIVVLSEPMEIGTAGSGGGGGGTTTVDVIGTTSITNQASHAINFSSLLGTYSKIVVEVDFVPQNSGVDLTANYSADGTTFLTSALYEREFNYAAQPFQGGVGDLAQTIWSLVNAVGNTAGHHVKLRMDITNPNDSTLFPAAQFQGTRIASVSSGSNQSFTGSMVYCAAGVWGGVRFQFSAGNIAKGWIKVTGYKD